MILQDIIFWVLSVAAIMAAFGVVFLNNIFRSALFLILVFLSFAGLYILLSAEFVAVVQLLVYVGAISILIIFALLITKNEKNSNLPIRVTIPAFFVVATFFVVVLFALNSLNKITNGTKHLSETIASEVLQDTSGWIGSLLVSNFVIPFEVVSILLLATLLGSLMLLRSHSK